MSTRIVIDNSQGGIENDGAEITLPINPQEGAVPIASSASSYVTHLAAQTMRNRIINGAMNISQRHSDRQVQPAGAEYMTDRWVGSNGLTYSGYFDGNGDYLTVGSNSAFDFGSGDFTVEAWVQVQSVNPSAIWARTTSTGIGFVLYAENGNAILQYTINNTSNKYVVGAGVVTNAWTHVAATRSGNTLRVWVNGISAGTVSESGTMAAPGTSGYVGAGFSPTIVLPMLGFISNLRIVKGTAVYTSAFTPSTIPLTAIANTSLLTCASSTFLDKSSNAFTVTANGNAAVNTLNPFPNLFRVGRSAGWSNYFDGSGDYLTLTGQAIGTDVFTCEAWVYLTALTGYQTIHDSRPTTVSSTGFTFQVTPTGTLEAYGGSSMATTSVALTTNTWTHIALVRSSGNTCTIYINGVSRGTGTGASNFTATAIAIGKTPDNYYFNGYISNLRIVKGTALYTTNFTPSTMPLVPVANTSLLTCGSETFQDKSSNNFAITAVGNAAVTSQSPFTVAPTGFTAGLQWSVLTPASASAADTVLISQRVEGTSVYDLAWGTASAKAVTLSFWVRSPVTGTYCVQIRNAAADRSYIAEYSVSAANTWEKKVITIPGDTSGTWPTTVNQCMALSFDLGSGSTWNGSAGAWQAGNYNRTTNQTNFIGTALASGVQSNNFLITGVQLEAGNATPFEFRPMQAEVALCQRYFARLGSLSGNYVGFGAGVTNLIGAQQVGYCYVALPQPMRIAPSPTLSNVCLYDTVARAATYFTHAATTETIAIATTATGLTTGHAVVLCGNNNPNAYLELNAEL